MKRGDIKYIIATGFAKKYIDFADRFMNEITCHAHGVHHLMPEARTVIEIGGQDSKFLLLDNNGIVKDFMMNDRCAAGTGRFFEVLASRLNVGFNELGQLAENSSHPLNISSMCIIFAETEINGLLTSGVRKEDIVAGVQISIANRISAMAGRSIIPPIAFTGGVALLSCMDKALSKTLGNDVIVVPEPQFTGALGAAILASQSIV
ncbi:MAG: acyl-CoA dehydratase activase [bacterium]